MYIAVNGTPSHSYGVSVAIMGSHLSPDKGEHTQPDRPVLDLPTPEGWKVTGYILRWFTRPETVGKI